MSSEKAVRKGGFRCFEAVQRFDYIAYSYKFVNFVFVLKTEYLWH